MITFLGIWDNGVGGFSRIMIGGGVTFVLLLGYCRIISGGGGVIKALSLISCMMMGPGDGGVGGRRYLRLEIKL